MSDTVTEPRFERGAGLPLSGLNIAYALPAEGKPPRFPDRRHWWIEGPDGWRLVDARTLSERQHVPLPVELTDTYFDCAFLDQMKAAAAFFAGIHALPIAADTPPWWWLD